VCVLTSSTTFSGGEALAYDLQAHGRAVVLGETTRGGAHPSIMVPLTEQIELRLPVARTISAATGSNWEGVGVQPDIALPAADALDVARLVALDKIGESRVAAAA
jgi:C-terminal processing protease CtpA/Prc